MRTPRPRPPTRPSGGPRPPESPAYREPRRCAHPACAHTPQVSAPRPKTRVRARPDATTTTPAATKRGPTERAARPTRRGDTPLTAPARPTDTSWSRPDSPAPARGARRVGLSGPVLGRRAPGGIGIRFWRSRGTMRSWRPRRTHRASARSCRRQTWRRCGSWRRSSSSRPNRPCGRSGRGGRTATGGGLRGPDPGGRRDGRGQGHHRRPTRAAPDHPAGRRPPRSRPTLVKILESHLIPYEQPGRHRPRAPDRRPGLPTTDAATAVNALPR